MNQDSFGTGATAAGVTTHTYTHTYTHRHTQIEASGAWLLLPSSTQKVFVFVTTDWMSIKLELSGETQGKYKWIEATRWILSVTST